ncbi:MAG TPA: TetR family transcriptional regulator [Anaerolineales bacterium]|nr:TetR family transcriptional regulator [Anaerolineales bacterium]
MSEPASKRGRSHDAEGTQQIILDAAEEVFAEHGFDGARIDAIAQVAGYNKSLIFQYFDDKLGLYSAVIRRADDQTRVWQNEALGSFLAAKPSMDPGEISDLLRKYVGLYFDYLVEHPRILRIYMWEMAEGWQTFSRIVSQRDFDDVDQFAPVLAKLQGAGLLRSDLNPLLQLSPALFVAALYLALLPLYKVLLPNIDFYSASELAHARQFVIEFTVNGLLNIPTEAKPGKR